MSEGINNLKNRISSFLKSLHSQDNDKYKSKCNCFIGKNLKASYKIFRCPDCKQKLRVPRGKGKINIICKNCGTEFVKRT